MADILIYSKDYCPYCTKAKELLKMKGETKFTEKDITHDADGVQEMLDKTGGAKTVPQIFINGTLVGGYDDLSKANSSGELDKLLAG